MGRRAIFTQAQLIQLNRSYDAGESSKDLAKRLGVSKATIERHIWKPRQTMERRESKDGILEKPGNEVKERASM